MLAGLGAGFWRDQGELDALGEGTLFEPQMSADEREARYRGWRRAVDRTRGWLENPS